MNEKYYVIAGTHREFRDFMIKKSAELWDSGVDVSLSNFVYVRNKDSIMGVKDPTGWLVGTWRERPDIRDVIYEMTLRTNPSKETLRKILDELNEQNAINL